MTVLFEKSDKNKQSIQQYMDFFDLRDCRVFGTSLGIDCLENALLLGIEMISV